MRNKKAKEMRRLASKMCNAKGVPHETSRVYKRLKQIYKKSKNTHEIKRPEGVIK